MNDPEIRALLYPLLLDGVTVDELPVGTTRADVTHITSTFMHGYELKGDGDTLKRVPAQLVSYAQAFDRVSFIATDKHIKKLQELLPHWVGISLVQPDGITELIPAQPSQLIDRAQIIALLRTSEIREFLAARGYTKLSKLRTFEFLELIAQEDTIPLAAVAAFTRQRLLDRMPQRLERRENIRLHRLGTE
jgi:hypothetical protein